MHKPKDPTTALVKTNLREVRARLGVSQRETANRAGISKSVLEKYESVDNDRIPNTRQLFRLAEVYGVSIDYLLGRTQDPRVRKVSRKGAGGTADLSPPPLP